MRALVHLDFISSVIQRLKVLKVFCFIILTAGCSSIKDNPHVVTEKHENIIAPKEAIKTQYVAIIKGQVNYQRGVTFYKTLTLNDAIKRCSGFTEFADLKNVQITRGKEIFKYNLSDNSIKDIMLEPNDVVEVPFNGTKF